MRILYITTIGSTMGFFSQFIKELLDNGHRVDIATNENERKVQTCYRDWGCKVYQISFIRSPFSKKNLKAISEIRSIVANNSYDIVHCHTPVAAACTRLACIGQRREGLKVMYTAHGFHFYKGAPLKNWLLYYPIEKILSYWTDVLITINREDYQRAKKNFYARKIEYVPGVGIDLERFTMSDEKKKENRVIIRKELGLQDDDIILLSVGELNKNKNHEIVIRALASLKHKKLKYVIAGNGVLADKLKQLATALGIRDSVYLLGFRTDVPKLMNCADIYILPSLREGLNVSLMEAMASNLPCLVSRIRGNVDLVEDAECYFSPISVEECIKCISTCMMNKEIIDNEKNIKKFASNEINKKMVKIYNDLWKNLCR